MVVIRAAPGLAKVITDCESVRTGCVQGRTRTTAHGSIYARAWAVIHSVGDEGDLSLPVVWMPAHTAEWQIGTAAKSDGTFLSDADRDANGLADRFAKAAAARRRMSCAIRDWIITQDAEVAEMATWVALVTVQANAFKLDDAPQFGIHRLSEPAVGNASAACGRRVAL